MTGSSEDFSFAFSQEGVGARVVGASSVARVPEVVVIGVRRRGEQAIVTVAESDSVRRLSAEPGRSSEATFIHRFSDDDSLTVEVRAEQVGAETHLRFAIRNDSTFVVEWIELCSLEIDGGLVGDGGAGTIVWPWNEGALIASLSDRSGSWFDYREIQYPSHGVDSIYPGAIESQFLAYCSPAGGFYLGAHDPAGRTKMIDFRATPRGVELVIRHYLAIAEGESLRVEYPTVIAPISGDWHAAAEIHRRWLDSSGHLVVPEDRELPDWYAESPIVVAFPVRGTHDTGDMAPNRLYPLDRAAATVDEIGEATRSQVMALLMHWEGTAPWAPPFVWPPFGGADAFGAFVDDVHDRGHLAGVYCSGLGWTLGSNLLDYALPREPATSMACAAPAPGDLRSVICTDQRTGLDLCAGSLAVRDIITDEVAKMASSGIDYIQLMDQNHGGTSYFCYEESHGHTYGPSDWTVDAVRRMGSGIRELDDVAEGRILLGCESAAADTFLRDFAFSDARFNLIYEIGHPIPLYQYLYHEHVHNFMGNQVNIHQFIDIGRSPDNLFLRLAHSFAAGDIMTLTVDDEGQVVWGWGVPWTDAQPSTPDVIAFVAALNEWRSSASLDHFNGARMQAPLTVATTTNTLFRVSNPPLTMSDTVSTRWTMPDGADRQLVINYRSIPVEVTIDGASAAFAWSAAEPSTASRQPLTGDTWTIPPQSMLLLGSDA